MAVERLGQDDVAARVEAPNELVALMFQVALHRVSAIRPWVFGAVRADLRVIAEPGVQFDLAAVGQMRDPPGQIQSFSGLRPLPW